MNKSRTRAKSLATVKPAIAHFSHWAPRTGAASLPRRFRAAVALDREKRPRWFLFDWYAFWEFLCRIDSSLAETLPDKEYFSKNPVGRLVDEIEGRWPFNEASKAEIKEEYERALRDIASGRLHPFKG